MSERTEMITNDLHGRARIYTATERITADNVMAELNAALIWHLKNLVEIDYLYWYRRGVCPILQRTKEIRPEINNKIVVNNADHIVAFKNGYFLTDPIAYIARRGKEDVADKVAEYNEYVFQSGKAEADNKLVDWFHTVGIATVLLEPNKDEDTRADKPVNCYALDPRSAFVVYSLRPGNRPVMGVNMVIADDKTYFDVFTEENVFRLSGAGITGITDNGRPMSTTATTLDSVEPNRIGAVPIIEYQYNETRMGSFENAIGILDAINLIESNRADGIELSVQQLCVAYNCEFEEGTTANTIRQAGMIVLRSFGENKADFKILDGALDQTSTQRTVDDLYNQMLEIVGVPAANRYAGSTSDNVGAVYLRSGWAAADTACRCTEDLFRASNKQFDRVFLKILKAVKGFELTTADFDIVFKRNSVDNILVKTQSALNMKNLGLSPEICLSRSGLSSDPITDIEVSQKYMDAVWNPDIAIQAATAQAGAVQTGNGAGSGGGPKPEAPDAEGNTTQTGENPNNMAMGHWVEGYWRNQG